MSKKMNLSNYDGKIVKLTLTDGLVYEGPCMYHSAEYCEVEYGRSEEVLQIDDWLFFKSQIAQVECIEEKSEYIWQNRTEHLMRLAPSPFQMIENGKKTIELRLLDEKRRRIKKGDIIRFENTKDQDAVLRARVEELLVFDSFRELYENLPLLECGYTAETIHDASPDDMNQYYSIEEQNQYGVVGIRISLV